MTRKDYVETAGILSSVREEIPESTFLDVVDMFANYFAKDNERFNREKFESACGLELVNG